MSAEVIGYLEAERAAAHSQIDKLYNELIEKTNQQSFNISGLALLGGSADSIANAVFARVLMCFDMGNQEWQTYFGINSRMVNFVDRRKQLVALLLHQRLTLKKIADLLGYKEHATVMNLRDGHYDLIATEPSYRKSYNELLEKLCNVKDVEPKNSG